MDKKIPIITEASRGIGKALAEKIFKRITTLKETGQFWFGQEKLPW